MRNTMVIVAVVSVLTVYGLVLTMAVVFMAGKTEEDRIVDYLRKQLRK